MFKSGVGGKFARSLIRVGLGLTPESLLPVLADELGAELARDPRSHRTGFEILTLFARHLGIAGLRVSGKYGTMQSAVGDKVVLRQYFENGIFAERTNGLLSEFFADSDGLYIDIGANIGMTLVPVARNPRVRCVAFEPEPVNFANLQANVAANCPHGNVTLNNLALFSRAAELEFELDDANFGDHRVRTALAQGDLGEQRRKVIRVQARPLDDWLDIVRPKMAVKIDVQGAEPFVFAGGGEFLSRADLLVFEYWPYSMNRMGGDIGEIFKVLQSSFRTVALAPFEEYAIGKEMTPGQAAWLLRATCKKSASNPYVYWDVIARK